MIQAAARTGYGPPPHVKPRSATLTPATPPPGPRRPAIAHTKHLNLLKKSLLEHSAEGVQTVIMDHNRFHPSQLLPGVPIERVSDPWTK